MICINKPKLSKTGNGEKRTTITPTRGLTASEVTASRVAHGDNRLSEQKRRGFFRLFFSNLGDPVIRVLLLALALNLLLTLRQSDWLETVGIALSILIATTISTISQLGSEAAFARLKAEGERVVCRVIRDGGVRECALEDIVVGDVVLVAQGENIPADGKLIAGKLTLDQSAMTGESREVKKHSGGHDAGEPGDEVSLFRGCPVLGGEGRMLVCAVGDATMLGGICREVQLETRDSPLKIRLSRLASQISLLGYIAAALVALAFLFNAFVLESGGQWEIVRMKLYDLPYLADTLLEALMLGLTVVVVAVPEGLPMMIAVVLSANIRRMVKDQVLVRKPAGIEAAGSMDLLFTDKTGTLTDGRLSVGGVIAPDGGEYDSISSFSRAGRGRGDQLLVSCCLGSAATMDASGHIFGGNATDRALLRAVADQHKPAGRVLDRLPFDSARKYAAVIAEQNGQRRTLIQGAPELLLPHVRAALDADGRMVPFAPDVFSRTVRRRMQKGERVLLLAMCEGVCDLGALARGAIPPLAVIGALTLLDRLRPEAARAVRDLQGAGVQVVMITGDAPDTAAHIAEQSGILVKGKTDLVLTGRELATKSDYELSLLLPRLAVVARALPTDKSRLVRVAQEGQRVVGMTGDGINDAPALRRADIGFAMGSGAPVAKDAGDILILDDNLSSIVRAVLYGRTIFKSIRKFITLQLTMNFCAVGVSMIGPFIGVDAPVTVVQMLWINLIMDTLGGLAFAGEAPLASDLRARPRRRDEPILCRYMVHEILFLGGYTVGLCVLFLKHPVITARFRATPDDLCHLTAFFALFIFASVFNCFNARTDRLRPCAGLSRNPAFLLIMGAVLCVQIVFVYLGGSVLRTMPLTPRELGLTALLALSVLPAEKIRGLLYRARGRKERY